MTSFFSRPASRRHVLAGALTLALSGIAILNGPAAHAQGSGRKDKGAFTVTLSDGRTFAGKGDFTIPNVAGKSATVAGTFVSYRVDLDTFSVRDYTLKSSLTRNVPTVIFGLKEPVHNSTLTGSLSLNLNNEQAVLLRSGPVTKMKIQSKDASTVGIFQMETGRGPVVYNHVLGPGFSYYVDNLGRTLFTNGVFIGRESPQLAARAAPATANVKGATQSSWSVQGGGRMGMVLGEDATQP